MQRSHAARPRPTSSPFVRSAFALALAALTGLSCKDSFPTAPTDVAHVMISPRAPTLIMGETVQLQATALDVNFTGIDGKLAAWSSASDAVATVDANGLVTAEGEGTVVITAVIDGHSDTTSVTVMPVPVDSIAIEPARDTMLLGEVRAFAAVMLDDEGGVLTGRVATWRTDNPAVASVTDAGVVTAAGLGTTTIYADAEGKTGSAEIVVIPVPVRQVVVSPNPAAVQQGFTVDLDAQTLDSIGGPLNGRTVTWQSLNTAIATVDMMTGVVTGVAVGSTTIRATSEGIVTDVPLTVSVPVIALGSTTANFQARWQTANPAAQAISVTNGGPWALTGLSVGVAYGPGATGWLSASLNSTMAAATLTLQPTTGTLAPGTYTATVTVSSSLPGVVSRTVDVTFTVLPRAIIAFSNDAPQFASQQNGALPASQAVTVTNAGTGTLAGLVTATTYGPGAAGWLNASLNTTTAPATLTLAVNTTALALGTYTAEVVVSSTQSATNGAAPDTVRVSYVVAQGPVIGLSRTTVGATAQAFSTTPDVETVDITNPGGGTLSGLSASISYVSAQTGWLGASLGSTTAPTTLTLTANASSLAAGTYSATVTVSSSVVGVQSQTVSVTFTVTPQPVITLTPDTRSFTATRGTALPAAQTIAISNSGGGTLSGLATSVEYVSGSGWLGASLNTTTAPATLTVQPNTTNLTAGTYTARVIVSSSVPGVAPDTATVSYTVQQPQIGLSTGSLTYGSRTRGYSDDAVVSITNIGQGTLSGLSVTDNASWITTSLASTTAPTTVTISTNTTNLAAGSYTGTVTVSSSLPGVVSQTVTVTVTVLQPSISLAATAVGRTIRPGFNASGSSIAVSNGGSGTLSGLSVTDNASWITASLNSTSAPATLTLTFSTSGLGVGTYVGTVTVSSTVPGVASQTVTVTLTVRWSFSADISPMLSSCDGCHTNTDNSVSDFNSWSQLVGAIAATSNTCDGRTRVVAGNAGGSLLYQKLANTHNCGVRMPQGGPYWSSADLTKLAEWINDGAPNN